MAEPSAAVLTFVELARIWEALNRDLASSVISCCYLQTRLLNYSAEPRGLRSYAIFLCCTRGPLRTCYTGLTSLCMPLTSVSEFEDSFRCRTVTTWASKGDSEASVGDCLRMPRSARPHPSLSTWFSRVLLVQWIPRVRVRRIRRLGESSIRSTMSLSTFEKCRCEQRN